VQEETLLACVVRFLKNVDVMYRGGDNGTVGTVQEEALLVLVWHA
jgi:hypothetical protein